MNKRLVLFDIDETILCSDGVGRRAMEAAMKRVFSRHIDTTGHNMSGKTDPQICREVLVAAGYEHDQIDQKLSELFETYVPFLAEEIQKAGRYELHAGISELIAALEKAPWAYLGLLTGNIEPGARLKLQPFDLNHKFDIGAFGSDSHDRMQLPEVAHLRANEHFGTKFTQEEIVIIGDAINDILCAKGYGARSIAVNTGRTPKTSLQDLSPDYLFDDLSATSRVLESIAG